MRKSLVIVFLAVFVASLIPSPVEAISVSNVRFFPCINEDGSYKLTILIGGYAVGGAENGVYIGYQVRIRKNGGPWTYYTYGKMGLTLKYGDLPEGTKFEVQELYTNGYAELFTLSTVEPYTHSITLQGTEYPACWYKCDGIPLFKMYVLTREDSYCILVSDVHPSVESQKALCFPGTDWVATRTACEGWVCNNDCWDCDFLGFDRFTLKDLWDIYQRRMGQ
jgi:hypothetical protein